MAPAFIKRASQVQTAPSRSAKEVLTLEDEAILLEIGDDLDKASPAATKAAYGPAQREFREWCLKKAVKDGKPALEDIKDEGKRALEDTQRTMVTGSRVGIFLKECVVGRPHKAKGKKGGKNVANGASASETVVGKTVGSSVINQYLSALCRLHKAQQAACDGQIPSPRTHPAVIAIGRTEKLKTGELKKSFLNDRTENTFLDGYCTDTELAAILGEGLRRNNAEGLRDRAMAALSHYGILRGESTRGIQLPDLQQLPLDEHEGPTPCDILVVLLYSGKTNQEGKTQVMGAMRNKRWDLCPLGALGLWLFYRFQLSGETFGIANDTFPRLDTASEWFPLFLFPGNTQQVEMKKDTHYHAVKAVLKNSGIGSNSSQVTHIFRGSAARMADLQGASERDISRAGRWDMSSMVQFYLTGLPRETMRVLAGFTKDRGSFWISRDVDPPKELADMIFPDASLWLEKLTVGDEQQSKSLAARGFIRLLLRLKRIILQDSVFLQQTQPNHIILRHPVFSSPLYKQYAFRVLEVVRTATSPISLQLQQAMPHMVTEMTNLRGILTADFRKIGTELGDEIEGLKELIECLEERVERGIQKQAAKSTQIGAVLGSITNVLQLLAGGVFETRLCLPAIDPAHEAKGTPTGDDDQDDDIGIRDGQPSSSGPTHLPAYTSTKSGLNILAPLLQAAASGSRDVLVPEDHNPTRTQLPNAAKKQSNHAETAMPATFVLESNHLTVKELWNEWYTGVFGRPSIIAMLEKKLPKSEGQRKLFARRKVIIDEIVKLAREKTVQESQIAERLDVYRVTNGMSITKLQDDIKQKRGKGESVI